MQSIQINKINPKKLRHILVDQVNYERLRNKGKVRDTFNDVITSLLDNDDKVNMERNEIV